MKRNIIIILFLLTIGLVWSPVVRAQETRLLLSTPKDRVELNSQLVVDIHLQTSLLTLGTDVVLTYDPQVLELTAVVPGDIYQDFSDPVEVLEKAKQTGQVRLSGVADFNQGIVANGVMGTLKFKPIQVGSTQIEVLYDQTSSTLTGVIPFEGEELNLLVQAPEPLVVEIGGSSWWQGILQFIKELWMDVF